MESEDVSSRATGSGSDTLLVLQPKSFRSFNNKDEYLFAMREDLADWFTCLYKIEINGDIFFEVIETGILLCHHANEVINFTKERREKGIEIVMKSYFVTKIPEDLIQYKENVKPGSFLARDNISNFISWCRLLGIPDDLRFETEDLVTRKNEKSVILCLLEVARVGAKLGMLAPTIVQMEEEIDAELAGEPPAQIITCDLKSLDEMVRHLVGFCSCPIQFPMIKVGDGKYQVGESRTLIFVRILRKHVMVRVGGGWDTLERYLDKHDPCRCHYPGHRPSTPGNPGQKSQTRRMSTPNVGPTANSITSPRRMSAANTAQSTPSKSSSSNARSKSPSPGSRRLPNSQLSTIPQNSETSQNNARSLSRRSQSPGPIPNRSHSPGPGVVPPSRSLPQTPGKRNVVRRSSGTISPAPSKPKPLSVRSSNTNRVPKRQKSLDAIETDDMETENGEKITLDEIKTMTLEDFKNLLNSALSVPTNPTSQCSDSPRSQESSDSFRNQTKTFVRHAKDSEKGPSWRSVREKARNVCDSASTRNYQRNMNNNNSHNKDNSRPKTPTSNYRPKTPTSGIKSAHSRPITPTSRPKTPSSSTRSSEEDLTYRGYIRPRVPSKASSFSSLDDEDAAEVADINGCGLSPGSKESSPAESVDRNPPMRSRTPGISGIPRPSTPSGIPRSITPASSSKPSTPSMARKHSLPDGTQRRVSLTRPTTPSEKSDKTYTGMYQARRSKTPGPNQERSYIPGGNRSITPGPRESWTKPPVSGSNQADGERKNRTVSRSLDFSRQRSKSVVDVRLDEENPLTVKSDQIKDAAAAASEDSRSRMKSKILALAEKRQRSISTGPKKNQDSADKRTVLMITRGKGGGHSITMEDNGETTYKSGCPGTPKTNRASLVNGNAERYRQRSKTPDPRLTNARTRSVEPRSIMARRNSGEPSAQSVSKRLEAWVDSTVNENKRKIPPRPKRSMTPNSLEFTEKDLEPRPFEEIKAALEKPVNGVVEDQTALAPPPEDPEMFMKMEKLFAKYREMELQASESQIPGMSSLAIDVVDHEGDVLTNDSTSILSSKSNSSPSCPSNNFSWTNSGSSRSSGSPGPSAAAAKNAANLHLHQNMTSTPIANSTEPKLGLEDLNSSAALVSKMKEVLKVRPRTEPKSGPKTRIPAPAMVKNQRSKSITNLNLSYDCAASNESKTDTDSAYEQSVTEFSEDTDELSEVSQLTTKCCDDSVLDVNRCKTPVPKLATPLTTGRSTVISNTNSTSRLVRAVSQEPVDHSRSNSLSSLSSRLSLSNADDDMDYV